MSLDDGILLGRISNLILRQNTKIQATDRIHLEDLKLEIFTLNTTKKTSDHRQWIF